GRVARMGPAGPAGRVPATTRAASGSAGAVWLPYYTADNRLLPTYGASVAVDATGGLHVAYAVYTGSEHRATYAYCAASCADKARWTYLHLGQQVQDVRLPAGGAGRPRMLLFGQPMIEDPGDPWWQDRSRYQYAECNAACTSAASWTITTISLPVEPIAQREYANNRYFALNPQGQPAFIYKD